MATKNATLTGNTSFSSLASANLLAQSAEQIALAAAPIVAVVTFGVGAAETSTLQVALTLPFLLFAIPAGVLADRAPRRAIMVAAELLRCGSLLAVLALLLAGLLSWPLLALFGCLGVCGTVLFSVAAPATGPGLVPAPLLATANARMELARTSALTAGPAIGGLLVGWTGAGAAFGLAAALSLAAAALLWRVSEPPRPAKPARHPLQEI